MEHADVRLSVRRQSRLQRRPGTSVDILGTRTCRVLRTPKGPGTDSRSGIAKHAHGRFWRKAVIPLLHKKARRWPYQRVPFHMAEGGKIIARSAWKEFAE